MSSPSPSSRPSRPVLLLVLGLAALWGCHSDSQVPAEQHFSAVQFDVTVPPETPADAAIFLTGPSDTFGGPAGPGLEMVYQGGRVFSLKARLPKDTAFTYAVRMTAPVARVALDAAGAPEADHTLTVHEDEENVALTVERFGPAEGETGARTVFIVKTPDITPRDAKVWLSGNQPELGNWNGAEVELSKAVDNAYAGAVTFPVGAALEFKVTRGAWETVEKSETGAEVANHTFTTGGGFERVSVVVGGWADLSTPPPPPDPTLTGDVRYLRAVTPTDPTLKPRDVIVWLPPGYETDTQRRYPVLYMHDGQNLMDVVTAFAGEWNVDETAQALVTAKEVEPLIIVGVYNTSDRIAEYTPVPFPPEYPDAGRADAYGQFLINDLKPRIDAEFRTKTGPESTGLAGSSLGGLVSLSLGLKHPEVFSRLGVVSPSVWWADRDIVRTVEGLSAKPALRIWEDIGTNEGSGSQAETVADAQALRDALVAKGWVLDSDLKYTVVQGGQHNEAAWSARFGDVLRFLFPAVP
ncbi:carbohydrate esterase [Corallococcus praedator]|uniref:Carbohydrate esterase n=1 Tax=Corallococcus praedator TaxID=2316724 RepID=A0ABX9QD52_9BACT|nr:MULTISPECIES: alpha/beta hydrolase-fold protein [Corallococcus]RKH25384.1 carbohydrate esterase [Corallococcus sp. CA031C]RKI02637.1 carbohydrate esterase [Corallococcus praedator]